MLDDLRQQAAESFGEEDDLPEERSSRLIHIPARFLGLTPAQTFVISLLLLALTCLLSTACLLVTGRVAPPVFWGSGF